MAERKGFEPSRQLPAYTLSRGAPSTTRPPLRGRGYRFGTAETRGFIASWFTFPSIAKVALTATTRDREAFQQQADIQPDTAPGLGVPALPPPENRASPPWQAGKPNA